MQTPGCRLKLDAAGSHLSIVRVAIYVAYLQPIYSAMQQKESITEHLNNIRFKNVADFVFIFSPPLNGLC
jgi:hypothetical protein